MPRHDWNTHAAHTQKPRHSAMHSPAHGKGHDKKIRAAKNQPAAARRPASHRRRDADDA